MRDMKPVWFPSLRQRPDAKLQLFCFPFAGGGASAYMRWHDLLPAWIDLWAVEYPAHETRFREEPVVDAMALAKDLSAQVAAAVHGPFALFGHSMGALLAYETARALKRDFNLEPTILFASGFSAPQLPPFRPPVRDLPEAAFRDELRRYGGTPEEILADEGFMAFVSPLLRRDLGLCETYAHGPGAALGIPIVAFGGYEDPTVPWHRLLAWSELTTGRFVAHFLPGEHFYIKGMAARVCQLIEKALESPAGNTGFVQPDRDEAHLWLVRVDQADAHMQLLRTMLSHDESCRAETFVQPGDQTRSIVARAALRQLLGGYTTLAPDALVFTSVAAQKPACDAVLPLAFNVSHSGEIVLVGVTLDQAVGVDVEEVKAVIDTMSLMQDLVTAGELRQLAGLAPEHRASAFFDLWVRKEACLKRSGEGFTGSPLATRAGLSPQFGPRLGSEGNAGGKVQSFTLASGYAAAVAADRPLALVTIRQWRPSDRAAATQTTV